MNISYNGFGENALTMECDSSLTAGMAVTVKEDGKAYPCSEDDAICGYAVNVRENYAAVQLTGFVNMKSEGNIKPGLKKLSVNAEGKITENSAGREFLVLCADGENTGFIL